MLSLAASAQSGPPLARMWQFVRVERGPDFQGMVNVPDQGDKFDLTGLQPLTTEPRAAGFWLVEKDGRQFIHQGDGQIRFNASAPGSPGRIPFYYEVLLASSQQLRLAVWIQFPWTPRPQHMLTYELEPGQ